MPHLVTHYYALRKLNTAVLTAGDDVSLGPAVAGVSLRGVAYGRCDR